MKKFLTLAVAAMAVASQAATISWQLSPTKATGYAKDQTVLLFVGAAGETFTHGDASDLTLSDYVAALLADGTDAATAAAFDSATTISGRSGITTAAKTKDVTYAADSAIVGMMIVLDGNGKYSSFSLSGTVAGSGDTLMNSNTADSSTGFQDLPTGGGGEQPAVPEPATGALALAGVALLFKRRRA